MTVLQPADVFDLLRAARSDLDTAVAKVNDALRLLSELDLPDRPQAACPHCGLLTRGPKTLAEHLYVSHDGPVPGHYLAIEAASAETPA